MTRLLAAVVAVAALSGVVTAEPISWMTSGITVPIGPPTMEEAQELQSAGDFDEAAEAWSAIAESQPDNGRAWFNRAYCLHAAGRLEEAIPAHKRAAQFDDFHGIAIYNLGCAYALVGRKDAAFEALKASQAAGFDVAGSIEDDTDLITLRSDPRFGALLASRPSGRGGGGGMGGMGGPQEIQQMIGQMQQVIMEMMPEIQRAVEQFVGRMERVLQELWQDDRSRPVMQKLAQLFGGGGGGQRDMRAARPTPPPPPAARPETRPERLPEAEPVRTFTLAEAQRLQAAERWKEAVVAWTSVAKQEPDNPAGWFGLAYCTHMSGDYEGAIKAHKKSATFERTKGIALYNLGCAYALTGRKAKAFEALRAAHEAGFDVAGSIQDDSDLDSLRDDRRYVDLLVDLGIEF